MTNEEARAILEEVKTIDDSMYQYNPAYLEALSTAIEALKAQPSEDAVSREFMYKLGAKCIAVRNKNDELVAIAPIESLPPVTPKQRTGKWIDAEHYFESSWATCSECKERARQKTENTGWGFSISFLKYCPNCGAEMEGE